MKYKLLMLAVLVAAVIAGVRSLIFVDETETVIVTQFGRKIRTLEEAGLHFKLPYQSTIRIDRRLQIYDPLPSEFLASEPVKPPAGEQPGTNAAESAGTEIGMNVILDVVVYWRVADPEKFLKTVNHFKGAEARIHDLVWSELAATVGQNPLDALNSTEEVVYRRDQLVAEVAGKCAKYAAELYGIEIVDVQLKRSSLPAQVRQSVFDRIKLLEPKRVGVGVGLTERVLGRRVEPQQAEGLTGDRNLIVISAVVQYHVADAHQYLFHVADVPALVENVTAAALSSVIASMNVDDVLTVRRLTIRREVMQAVQQTLDRCGAGVTVTSVTLEGLTHPQEVAFAFREVNSARQYRQTAINEARGYANLLLSQAALLLRTRDRLPETPQDTVSALFDAAANGDDAAYLRLICGELRKTLEDNRTQLGVEAFRQNIRSWASGVKGLAYTRGSEAPPGLVALEVEIIFADHKELQTMLLAPQRGGWAITAMSAATTVESTPAYGTPVFELEP